MSLTNADKKLISKKVTYEGSVPFIKALLVHRHLAEKNQAHADELEAKDVEIERYKEKLSILLGMVTDAPELNINNYCDADVERLDCTITEMHKELLNDE